MFITKKSLSRRQLLRGAGAMLSLPLLDAMVPALSPLAAAAKPIRRLGFVYVPNGAIMSNWIPAAAGRDFEFSPILQPLEPLRDHVRIVSGLSHNVRGSHAVSAAAWLTGVGPAKKSVTELDGRITIDQIAAQHLGQESQLASLELGLERPDFAGECDAGYSCAYTNTVSWRDETTPMPMETDPRAAFERIFGDGDSTSAEAQRLRLEQDRSILDSITRDASSIQRSLGPSDRLKLNQYLDAVRDVERRIQLTRSADEIRLPDVERPAGVPERFEDYAKLMFDLQVLAYQCDLTRVMTFMYGKEVSNRSYPEIGVPEPHHASSHHQNDKEKMEKVTKINLLHVQMFAYYLERLRSTPDGEGSLLDHSTILYGAGMSDPNTHDHHNMPAVVAGHAAGQITGGYHARYPLDTPLTNLFLSLLESVDVPMETISDSTVRLNLSTQA